MRLRRALCFSTLVLVLVCGSELRAQIAHPVDSLASVVDSFSATVELSGTVTTETDYEIIVWLLGNGEYDYQFMVDELTFSSTDGCSGLASVSLSEIAGAVANDAIVVGVGLGYPMCDTMAFVEDVRIWTNACATRSGSGCSTSFSPCGNEWTYRRYEVDCSGDGNPDIYKVSGQTGDCSGESGCESTYIEPSLE